MANKLLSENAAQAGDGRVLQRDDNRPPTVVEMLTSDLVETYGKEFEKIDPIRARANALEQKIESDEDLAKWTQIHVEASALFKSLDAARLNEQRPLQAAIKEVFEPKLSALTRITDWIRKAGDDFNRKKLAKQRAEEAAGRERLAEIERKAREDAAIAAEFGDTDAAVEHVTAAAEAQQHAAQATTAKAADVARVRTDSGAVSTAQAVWKFTIDDYSKVDLNSIRAFFTPAEIDKAVGKVVRLQKGATKIEGVKVYEDVGTSFRR